MGIVSNIKSKLSNRNTNTSGNQNTGGTATHWQGNPPTVGGRQYNIPTAPQTTTQGPTISRAKLLMNKIDPYVNTATGGRKKGPGIRSSTNNYGTWGERGEAVGRISKNIAMSALDKQKFGRRVAKAERGMNALSSDLRGFSSPYGFATKGLGMPRTRGGRSRRTMGRRRSYGSDDPFKFL